MTHASRRWWGAVSGIATAALLLRVAALDRRALWYDEAVTAHLALSKPAASLVRGDFIHDGHVRDRGNPPLYFLGVKAWTRVMGRTEADLRALSVIGGVLAVPFVALLGRRIAGPGIGLLAALLWSGSPFAIALAQEARSFSMLGLLVVMNAWALVRWIDDRRTVHLVSYSVTLGLAVSLHYYAMGLPVVHGATLASLPGRRSWFGAWLLALAGALLVCLPWAPVLWAQLTLSGNLVRNADNWVTQFATTAIVFSVGDEVPRQVWALVPATAVSLLGFVLPAAAGLLRTPGPAWARTLLGTWWLGPILGPALVSVTIGAVYSPRYASIALPPFLLLAGIGVASLPRQLRLVSALSIVLATALPLWHFYRAPSPRPDWRLATASLANRTTPRDLVLVDATSQTVVFLYYARERGFHPPRLFGLERPQPPTPELPCRVYDARSLAYRTVDDCTSAILEHDVIWLVLVQGTRAPDYYLTALQDRSYARRATHQYPGMQLWEFRRLVPP